jgi:hypothetical protein
MKVEYLQEPELVFGKGKSICPRDGFERFNVYDTVEKTRKHELLIGIIGIDEDIEKMKYWLNRFSHFAPAKQQGKQKGLFRSFPGFNSGWGFCAKLLYDTQYERVLSPNGINKILIKSDPVEKEKPENQIGFFMWRKTKLSNGKSFIGVYPNSMQSVYKRSDVIYND